MNEVIHVNGNDAPKRHNCEHPDYEYMRSSIVSRNQAAQCVVSVYEVPPGKSAYPYHYHAQNEEVFYIISGQGLLRTPDGERKVEAGEFLFFPAHVSGAHKLTNCSPVENLVYIDFDTDNALDVACYPDTGKIGIWGKGIDKVYTADSSVGYYDGE